MNIKKAKEISKLIKEFEFYEKLIETLNDGYKDEWTLTNHFVDANIEINSETYEFILEFFTKKIDVIKKKIEKLN